MLTFGPAHTPPRPEALHGQTRRQVHGHSHGHRSRSVFDRFNLCVANHEAGEPGSELESTVDWHIVDNGYGGGFQFVPSTWLAAGGGRYAREPQDATPEQQTIIFNSYEKRDPGAWPRSVPACGGP